MTLRNDTAFSKDKSVVFIPLFYLFFNHLKKNYNSMFMTIKNFSQKSKKSLGFFLMIFIFYEVNYNLSQKEGKF